MRTERIFNICYLELHRNLGRFRATKAGLSPRVVFFLLTIPRRLPDVVLLCLFVGSFIGGICFANVFDALEMLYFVIMAQPRFLHLYFALQSCLAQHIKCFHSFLYILFTSTNVR